ncbi:MAG TPA: hydroxyacid-oxoacid transhydrogenase [Bryobacteraceae bacterium]|nr:hydroxyacid-oxoacid transhydrogenase [Bryobacteraceae bacterium]
MSRFETAFEMATSAIRFGPGVTREIGADLAEVGIRHALVVTDPWLRRLAPVAVVEESLHGSGVPYTLFDQVKVEPTDVSFRQAIDFAKAVPFDAIVAVGGGSVIDTAKAVNLYICHPPGDFLDYVNPPIGKGKPVPGPVKPLFAIPTTAGTGSETTGVAIFDFADLHAKTGIAHRRLKPTLGYLDPENTRTMPPQVAAATGLDVLSHAIESYTAVPYSQRPAPDRPILRPAYQGNNPISDVWSLQALRMVGAYLVRAAEDPSDEEARSQMILASAYAGVGFGNAGVHLPHGMSYPVSGMVKTRGYTQDGYPGQPALIPHGFSVILNAPAVFRFTAAACPSRHLDAAAALGLAVEGVAERDAGRVLSDGIIAIMERLRVPRGLRELGYAAADIPALVAGTLPQHRVTKLSPRPAAETDLERLFEETMQVY